MWSSLFPPLRGAALVATVYLAATAAGVPQEDPPKTTVLQTGSVRDALQGLESQVRELNAALLEMQAQVTRSRAEAQELRKDLEAARGQLASFKSELEESRGPVAPRPGASVPGAATGATATPNREVDSVAGAGEAAQSAEVPLGPQVAELGERVANLEEDQQLLGAKVVDQYQTKVESGSKYRVRLSGIALLNVFGTRGSVDNLDLPTLARPKGPLDSRGSFGATVRQSLLGLEVFGPTLGRAKTRGDIQFDFFGGFPETLDGVTAGLVRLRTATVHLDWARTSIVAGQDTPFFSPLSPTSLASLAYPALSYSGNLWTWTPQLRVERRLALSDDSSILVQGGILDSLTGQPPYDQSYRSPQAGERSGQPAYATRLAWTRTAFGRPLTVGAAGYYARQNWGFGRAVDAWAAATDWDLPLSRWFSLTAELYRGRAIGGLGAAGGRSALFSGPLSDPVTSVLGLNSAGGWTQLKFKPAERLEFNGAFGEDYPFASDLGRFSQSQSYIDAALGRNQSAFVNGIYHLRSNLLFSLEYRRLWTSEVYVTRSTADHVNVGLGILF